MDHSCQLKRTICTISRGGKIACRTNFQNRYWLIDELFVVETEEKRLSCVLYRKDVLFVFQLKLQRKKLKVSHAEFKVQFELNFELEFEVEFELEFKRDFEVQLKLLFVLDTKMDEWMF